MPKNILDTAREDKGLPPTNNPWLKIPVGQTAGGYIDATPGFTTSKEWVQAQPIETVPQQAFIPSVPQGVEGEESTPIVSAYTDFITGPSGLQAKPRQEKDPLAGYRGGGGKAKSKPNLGLDIGKKLSFLPEGLRPLSEAYLPPNFRRDLEAAFVDGTIDKKQYDKALKILEDYENRSVTGTQVGADRGGQELRRLQIENQQEMMKLSAARDADLANKTMELVSRLESSDILFQAAEKRGKAHLKEQVDIIRSKINRMENQNFNPFGNEWGAIFGVIGAALSTASSLVTKTPNMAAGALMAQIDRRMASYQAKTNALKAGIQGEFNIYQLLRQDLQDDRAAHHASKASLIRRAKMEVEALGLKSASAATKVRAQQISAELTKREQVEEQQLLAHLTMKAEAEKAKALMRGRGAVGKLKDDAYKMTQYEGMHPLNKPLKGYAYTDIYTPLGDKMMGGFLPEAVAKEYAEKYNGIAMAQQALDTMKHLSRRGSWWLSSADRNAAEQAKALSLSAYKDAFKMGALDAGAERIGGAFLPDVFGPLSGVPFVGGEHEKKLAFAQTQIDMMQETLFRSVQNKIIPGKRKPIEDSHGNAEIVDLVLPDSPARAKSRSEAAYRSTHAQDPKQQKFQAPLQ